MGWGSGSSLCFNYVYIYEIFKILNLYIKSGIEFKMSFIFQVEVGDYKFRNKNNTLRGTRVLDILRSEEKFDDVGDYDHPCKEE